MNTMTYKGQPDGPRLGFHAEFVAALRAAFEEAVDDYLEACAKVGKPAEKTASGKLMLRVSPKVHRAALMAARSAGTSLNQWAAKVLEKAARR